MTISHLNKYWIIVLTAGLFLALFVSYVAYKFTETVMPEVPDNSLYRNSGAPINQRVADLMSYMTLEEKIGQMALVEKNSLKDLEDIQTYGLGGMLSGSGGRPDDNTPLGWKQMVETFVSESRSSRLGIPILYGVDAIHGHSNIPGATVFPHFIGLGASGDAILVKKVAQATADELLATGVRWSYSPTYDMPEDIRWGRVYETFSDDPLLVSSLGSAYIRGLQENQAESSTTISVLATPKHYIGVGGMLWNTSSNDTFRIDQGSTPADEKKLRAHYLPPFQKAIEVGAASIMIGLNRWGDTKIASSTYLIQTVLKEELGFTGFVVSDWYGIYEVPGNNYTAAVTAINAGVDMAMLPFDYKEFARDIRHAVNNGDISEARIDDAVQRILTAKFQLGLFETSTTPDVSEVGSSAHRALARDAVAKSLVLLKNDGDLLPIKEDVRTIRVAGSAADNIGRQAGAWTVEWQGIDGNWLPGATSILAGIKESAGEGSVIQFDTDANFSFGSPKADLGIAIVGEPPYAEGLGDNPSPFLSKEDIAVINRLKETSLKVVVILVTGRPLIITEDIKNWDATVVAWLPGSEGAGVADVLFGAKPFTGKLPLPWPSTLKQLPIVGGITNDRSAPLFPRYFGLQY